MNFSAVKYASDLKAIYFTRSTNISKDALIAVKRNVSTPIPITYFSSLFLVSFQNSRSIRLTLRLTVSCAICLQY